MLHCHENVAFATCLDFLSRCHVFEGWIKFLKF
jgi:hypothetical protein